MSGFAYLAVPYSRFPLGREAAFKIACRVAAHLLRAGLVAFSPVSHSHPIAEHGDIDPLDHALWMNADRPMMDAAHGLIVFKALGWRESLGVQAEIAHFVNAGKPVAFMSADSPLVIPKEVLAWKLSTGPLRS